MPTVLTEGNYLNDLLKWEMENYHSREQVTVLAGQDIVMGSVIGKIKIGSVPTTGTAGTNTGTGTCVSVTGGAKIKVGVYTLRCVGVAANSGIFSVRDPDGEALPDAVMGAYTNLAINFTLTDGATDFALGDSFTITAPAGSEKVKELNLTGIDGSEDAYGIMIAGVDTTNPSADKQAVAIVRDAQIVADYLAWPAGASDAQKASALTQLANAGIVTRTDV
jgi:hypothetical protein